MLGKTKIKNIKLNLIAAAVITTLPIFAVAEEQKRITRNYRRDYRNREKRFLRK